MRALVAVLAFLALAPPAAASGGAIVGGKETRQPWPFMVYLEQGRQEVELADGQICGGTLVAPTWVLTAAHCLSTLEITEPAVLTVVAGRRVRSHAGTGQRIQARRVVPHPEFDGEPKSGHDVMLVELTRAAAGEPVLVAGPGEEPLWATGAMATILGWGDTSEGGRDSDALREAQVPVVDDAACASSYEDTARFHPPTMVCAGYPQGGVDSCQGDSGGPILVPAANGGWRQFGVTSFGEGCGRAGFPGVYAEAGGETLRSFVARHVPGAVAPAPAPTPSGPPAGGAEPPPRTRPDAGRRKRAERKRCARKHRKQRSERRKSSRKRACAKREASRRRR